MVSAIAAGHPVAASLTAALTGAAASAEGYTAATAAAAAQLWEYMPPIPKPPPYRLHPPVNMGGRSLIPFQPPGPSHDRMIVWTRLMNSNGPPRHSRSLSQPHTTRARTKPRPPDLPTHVAQQQMGWQHGHAFSNPFDAHDTAVRASTAWCASHTHGPCAICLEVMRHHTILRTLPCFHIFHDSCIRRWFRELRNHHRGWVLCPVCKAGVSFYRQPTQQGEAPVRIIVDPSTIH